MYHAHPPTGWISWQGDLRPRAFDLNKVDKLASSPWEATAILANVSVKLRYWRTVGQMDHLVRNADGDELLFIHEGEGHLFCDYGHLGFRDGDYLILPRSTMWRIEAAQPVTALLIEATNDSYRLPEKGIVSHRFHLPPSAHTTFVASRFVVCTFTPRPAESDPGALKVPFFHNNDDYDEIIFYHHGKFFSRDNIHPGMMTFHPCGFTHGLHPRAFALAAQSKGRYLLDEVAVMLDTRDAVTVANLPAGVESTDYVDSWKTAK